MILQRDERLLPEIRKYGCYFMSILFLINKYKNYEWDTDKINEYYSALKHLGAIEGNSYIIDPDQVFLLCGMKVKYTQKHEPPERQTMKNEIEILKFVSSYGAHFVVGDGRGNVAYDPWGVSNAVKHGRVDSKRIFRMTGE